MSDITLSSAVRSNLLSLQSTADLMSKTQERLATGLKVNSALDNPTNFFTASALNSRASDLGRLLDGVSNATQTLEAADNGISAITKLVESAQATARQALQTPSTIDVVGAATAGTTNAGAFSALDITGGSTPADAGALTGTGFSAVNLGAGSAATAGEVSFSFGSATGPFDGVDDAITFDVTVDGGGTQNITIDAAAVGAVGNNDSTIDDAAEFVAVLNNAITGATATESGGTISITSDTTGASSSVTIANLATVDTNTSGFTDNTGIANGTDTGSPLVAADSISFDLAIDGGGAQTITIDTAALDQYDAANPGSTVADRTAITGAELAAVITQEIGDASLGATASFSGGELSITSGTTGTSSDVTISSFTESVTGGGLGLANGTDAGAAATPATDSISFDIAVDGGTAQTVTIDDAAVTAYNTANSTSFDSSALTAANVAALINDQVTGATAAVDGTSGNLTITSGTTGASSSVAISNYSATAAGGSTGIANGSNAGTDTSTTTSINPERAEFVTQYNELMGQIDELAEDAGFNGVNLLDGDDLSVIFNEDGSSTLSITGVSFDAAGLGLGQLASTGLDTDTAINATLDTLDTAIGSLRSQASEFGSNLSIVETREDFTKSMINTLETGAANLTLADTNEEGANLLALQTRQQLSSTALSLASQADQNVLRLF
jgi:flagellin-like hook-associated protein FlgL